MTGVGDYGRMYMGTEANVAKREGKLVMRSKALHETNGR